MARRCSCTSSAARSPFMASMRPSGLRRGRHHRVSLSSAATARDVTTSISPAASRTDLSSARPRITVTGRPSSSTASARKSARRSSGSTRTTAVSGRARASGIPGRPAPLPTSAMRSPAIHQLTDGGAVQDVAVPQPVDLAGADQTALDPGARQDGRVFGRRRSADRQRLRPPRAAPAALHHVSRETSSASAASASRPNYMGVTRKDQAGRTTTRRDGSAPSLSLRTPSTAETAS